MKILVRRYHAEIASDWAIVLSASKNGLFLFDREFIEYHGDRFTDLSVIAYADEKPVALMPAAINLKSGEAVSHPGLTFGGAILHRNLRSSMSISLINSMLDKLRDFGAKSLKIKLVPQLFGSYPAAELDYALWRRGFKLVRRDLSSILPLHNSLPFNKSKNQSIKKAKRAGLLVGEASTTEFFSLLEEVLRVQHGITPVHTHAEIKLLMTRFPSNIIIRAARSTGKILAGTMIFLYEHVWHTQYLACGTEGRELGALDLVIGAVKDEAIAANARYLSFGISTEAEGSVLNEGLLWQKESYGARAITYDFVDGVL